MSGGQYWHEPGGGQGTPGQWSGGGHQGQPAGAGRERGGSAARGARRAWPLVLVGVLVGAALGTGATLAATGGLFDSEPAELALPETLDDLRDLQTVQTDHGADAAAVEARGEVLVDLEERLSAAYDGAATAARTYGSDDLETIVTVYAVAAESPGLWSPQDSDALAELLGFASPQAWVVTDDDAECLVRPADPSGLRSDDSPPTRDVEALITLCQLTTDGLTVRVQGDSSVTPERGLELVREAAEVVEVG